LPGRVPAAMTEGLSKQAPLIRSVLRVSPLLIANRALTAHPANGRSLPIPMVPERVRGAARREVPGSSDAFVKCL
jgi:hypothetical protein